MPDGSIRNALYRIALPIIGKRCEWSAVDGGEDADGVRRALKSAHAVGACVQRIRAGRLAECYTAGYYALEPDKRPVTRETVFRTASIAKLVAALLVMRLQTLGRLDVCEDVSDFLGYPVRNPYCPEAPITLGMLMSHSSGIIDGQAYARSLNEPCDLRALLSHSDSFAPAIPGVAFRYSNLAAGMIGSMLEKRFGESIEALAQKELFKPLGVEATFDITTLADKQVADSYRVLPPALAFSASGRMDGAHPLTSPDPERHYQYTAGNLFVSAPELARLALVAWRGADGFINERSLSLLKGRLMRWPVDKIGLYHGMGALQTDDARICDRTVYGHQGIAYGAANGVMFTDAGDGFALLTSGASESRSMHFTTLNRDLISLFMRERKPI